MLHDAQILDSRDLSVSSVQDYNTKQQLSFKFSSSTPFGEKLEISLPDQNRYFLNIILQNYIINSNAV